MRVSLKELLVVLSVVSVGIASLVTANSVMATLWLVAMFLVACIVLIDSFFATGRRRAYCVGAICVGLAYGVVLAQSRELSDPYGDALPTSTMLRYPWEVVAARRNYWLDPSGQRYSTLLPPNGAIAAGGGTSAGSPNVFSYVAKVSQESFMAIGHCLWALLLGYLGDKYAVWVYGRREVAEH